MRYFYQQKQATLPDGTTVGFVLARYNPDGSLDTSFDGNGKVTAETLRTDGAIAGAVAIQSNGKIVGRLLMTLLEVTSKRAESLPSFKK